MENPKPISKKTYKSRELLRKLRSIKRDLGYEYIDPNPLPHFHVGSFGRSLSMLEKRRSGIITLVGPEPQLANVISIRPDIKL